MVSRVILQRTLFAALFSVGAASSLAESIRVLEDTRFISTTVETSDGTRSSSVEYLAANPLFFTSKTDHEVVPYDRGPDLPPSIENIASAQQLSLLETGRDHLRAAGILTTRSHSLGTSGISGPGYGASRSEWTLTFEVTNSTEFVARYEIGGTGDEAPGGQFKFSGPSVDIDDRAPGFWGSFLGSTDSVLLDSLAIEVASDPTVYNLDENSNRFDGFINGDAFSASGLLTPGIYTLTVMAGAANDNEDYFGSGQSAFELVLTPIPEPTTVVLPVIWVTVALRRRGR